MFWRAARAAPISARMVRLQISAAAFAAIVATLPGNVNVENKRAPNGDVYVWLDPATVAKLRHLRGPGDSYSDAIIALAGAVRLTGGCATDAS